MLVSENFGWLSNMVSESDSVGLKKWDISVNNFSIPYTWHLIWEYNISLFFILSPHYLQCSQAGFSSRSFLKCNLELTLSFITLWSVPVHFSLMWRFPQSWAVQQPAAEHVLTSQAMLRTAQIPQPIYVPITWECRRYWWWYLKNLQ